MTPVRPSPHGGALDWPQAKTVFGFREPMIGVVIDLWDM
jgi:hypothetical protein